ncbi:MAG: thiol oxidoreductase [Verrucomicrobia bacterium]|nr:thiol oxidoreductase [Verrucomicrobiota bacterium]
MVSPVLRNCLVVARPLLLSFSLGFAASLVAQSPALIGREVAVARHLEDGQETMISIPELLAHGRQLFDANWTGQEGGGRPLTKGNGNPLADPTEPLVFPRNFNRISAPDANSCFGCHNSPSSGGNGDIVANVFVLGQRFDFATFNGNESLPTKANVDELGRPVTLQTIANSRATLGMFGSGYIEMLARQMTTELQAIRDATVPGSTNALTTKGVSFGSLIHRPDGTWDTSQIQGLPAPSVFASGATPPNLLVRPFHQVGNVISLRQFSNNAFNHHHGIQSTERFGLGTDPDGDGHRDELTRADVTAVTLFQATLPVPGRVIPNQPEVEEAVLVGEAKFQAIGCAVCHVPNLPLTQSAWVYTEPNPFNPQGNLRPGEAPAVTVDLTGPEVPAPRLQPINGVVWVPAFTDLKLHDICSGPTDPNVEAIDMNQPAGSPGFFGGNRLFLTRKLWGASRKPNFFHHGQYTTMREAILAHAGEALVSRNAFEALSAHERDCVVEFLKTLQVLPAGTPHLFVDEAGRAKSWPPARFTRLTQLAPTRLRLEWAGSGSLYAPARLLQLQRSGGLSSAWENVGSVEASSAEISTEHPAEFYRLQPQGSW